MDDGYRINSAGELVLIEELRGKPMTTCICNAFEDDECICGASGDEEDDIMTEVFVLVDFVEYEGESVLGVYSTLEAAQTAVDEWENTSDNVYVYTISVDAPPEPYCYKPTLKVNK